MQIDHGPFKAVLVTKGRVSKKTHQVTLRGVEYNDKIYFSRHRPDSDWFKNILANSEVVVKHKNSSFLGEAKPVTDVNLNQKISELKYPGEERAKEKRVSIEITLHEQL